jgi:ribosomal protein S18 acetylase RimI-like enzyme
MKYRIRNATIQDIEKILVMLRKAHPCDPRYLAMDAREYIKKFMREPYYKTSNHILLFNDEDLVGELLASPDVGYGILKNNSLGLRLNILPEHISTYTITLLLQTVEKIAQEQGFVELQVTLDSEDKLKEFLEAQGFKYNSSGYWMVKEDCTLPVLRNMQGYVVRHIKQDEIFQFYKTVNLAFSTDENWKPYEYEEFAQKYIYPEYVDFNGYFVALDGEKFVGTVVAWAHNSPDGIFPGGEIRALGVLPEYRNKGIGSFLLARALEFLISRGITKFYLGTDSYNTPALAIYRRFGFRVWREHLRYRKRIG